MKETLRDDIVAVDINAPPGPYTVPECKANETCPICPHRNNCVSKNRKVRKIDVTTPDKFDLQKFTPEQIEEYCESIERRYSICCYPKGQGQHKGVLIIRQLQAQLQDAGDRLECEGVR